MSAKTAVMGRLLGNAAMFSDKQVVETLDMLVQHAVTRNASDIHLEPHDRFILVRYRIDGALRGLHKLPRAALPSLLTQLKKRSGINEHETALPQSGQFEARAGEQMVTVHVSTMPVYGGEKAVLHLSMHRGKPADLHALGFWGNGLTTLQAVLASPHGLVIVAGPRHSGLSSTLFSLLDQLNSPLLSIATIEDRPSHRLPGVNQTYIAASGLPVHDALAAALNQDPNIIMLGEVPDRATAELAIHAATTGHLVLAGLHVSGAVAAMARLRSTGVEPFQLTAGLRASVGQRLVRSLCPHCRERYALTADEQKALRASFGLSSTTLLGRVHDLERQAVASGLGDAAQLNSSPTGLSHLWRAHPEGCSECHHSGYQGRTALTEVLTNTEHVQKALMDRDHVGLATLHQQALRDGFVPLALDGLIKSLRGLTTTQEVLAAVEPDGSA